MNKFSCIYSYTAKILTQIQKKIATDTTTITKTTDTTTVAISKTTNTTVIAIHQINNKTEITQTNNHVGIVTEQITSPEYVKLVLIVED